jgi:nicotinamide-nucleotide amidase
VSEHGFHLVGLGESDFADRAGDWMARSAEPRMGVTSHTGVLTVSLRALAATPEEARRLLEERRAAFLERFGEHVYSEDGAGPAEPDLAVVVGRALIERGVTLTTAESCTGGLLAQRLTAVPGISAVYPGGWITYSNAAKTRELGVPGELLERHGAVSGEVAAAMATGAARESGARLAVSLTGVAGPEGGTPEKPVGLVWLGLAVDASVTTRELRLPPVGREAVRTFAVHAALDGVRRALPGLVRPG